MDMEILQGYLGRANYGKLSGKEFKEVATLLESTGDDGIRRKCIVILGWDGEADHSALVEKFVHSTDQHVQQAAVSFLICDAGRPDLCHTQFMDWLGENTDDSFQVLTAVQAAGDAYKVTQQPYILERLLHFLACSREAFSESAKDSLVKALTPDYNDQTPEAERFRASKPTIEDFVRLAEQILSQSKN
jgi:hypothetical protein